MSEWRAIDSAPRDGTRILAVQPSGYITCMQFCSEGYWRSRVDQTHHWTPTHWMPLPSPPEPPK